LKKRRRCAPAATALTANPSTRRFQTSGDNTPVVHQRKLPTGPRVPTARWGCTGCHLDHFQGDGTVPRLAGLSREYLTKTMADFRTRARGNNPGMSDLMLATAPDDLAAIVDRERKS